ncbi:hypothetical protein D3C86_1662500 [compost metagenome]
MKFSIFSNVSVNPSFSKAEPNIIGTFQFFSFAVINCKARDNSVFVSLAFARFSGLTLLMKIKSAISIIPRLMP